MPVPLHTTTVSVLRVPADSARDPYDPQPEPEVVDSGVPAHISSPSGRERTAGGSQEVVEFRLTCDPTDLTHTDRVQDDQTGVSTRSPGPAYAGGSDSTRSRPA